jgi:5-methyltetrahydrofolate--homocysteine methyltransferase
VRALHAGKKQTPLWPIGQARANKAQLDWASYTPPAPKFIGRRVMRGIDLKEIAAFIDWTPFFQTWDLTGHYPAILTDPVVGLEAARVFNDAQALLAKIIAGRWLTASAVVGFWPANAVRDDDITLYADARRANPVLTWYGLRQQIEKAPGKPSRCLADFIAPRAAFDAASAVGEGQGDIPAGPGCDYLGAFAVTAGLGASVKEAEFLGEHDDYRAILLKSLADRLAEAAAEWLHWRTRTDWWGYAADETLAHDALIAARYQGIRPAPGYPACPDHSVKRDLFALLHARDVGMRLTDSLAMLPAASVSGFYFSHPESRYFNVGRIDASQLADMAVRRGMTEAALARLLAPNLQ